MVNKKNNEKNNEENIEKKAEKNNKKIVEIKNFNLSYGNVKLFENFNFSVKEGSCAGIFGPTGTGKTSLLNKIVEDYIKKYRIAYIFQDNKLIENLTVLRNVTLPLDNLIEKSAGNSLALNILKQTSLKYKSNEKVSVLSGGERQRVNIARALCYLSAKTEKKSILLMDEPFSAQDENNRNILIELSKKICNENNVTTVIVSHNMLDLEKLCDFILKL